MMTMFTKVWDDDIDNDDDDDGDNDDKVGLPPLKSIIGVETVTL